MFCSYSHIYIHIDNIYFMYLQALNNAGFGSKPLFNCLSLQFADQLLLQFLASARFAEDFGVDMETSKKSVGTLWKNVSGMIQGANPNQPPKLDAWNLKRGPNPVNKNSHPKNRGRFAQLLVFCGRNLICVSECLKI